MGEMLDPFALCEHRLPLLETALAQVREAVYLLDDHGRPHYINDEACRMLGYDRETLLGMQLYRFNLATHGAAQLFALKKGGGRFLWTTGITG